MWYLPGSLILYCCFVYKPVNSQCHQPIGLESGKFPDEKISASSYLSSIKMPKHARLRGQFAWTAKNTDNQYLQFDLSNLMEITYIDTQGGSTVDEYVTLFYVTYSTDGAEWVPYKNFQGDRKEFKGNFDSLSIVRNVFDPPIIARFVRINPLKWNLFISMRMELYGCRYNSYIASFRGRGELIRYNLTRDQLHGPNSHISLRFLTGQKDGILIHSTGWQGDTISLQLRDGRLVLYIALGGSTQNNHGNVIRVGSLLDDNQWHMVRIIKHDRNVTLTVDQMAKSQILSYPFDNLDLDTYMTFGGIYVPMAKGDYALTPAFQAFRGCMDNIMVNRINVVYELRKKAPAFEAINKPGDTCKPQKSYPLTFTLPETHFEWKALEGISALNITLEFRAFHGNGLLAHHVLNSNGAGGPIIGNSRPTQATRFENYLSLLLKDGRIQAIINVLPNDPNALPSSTNQVYDESTYKQIIDPFGSTAATRHFNDGLWHRVTLYIKTNELQLNIDGEKSVTRRKLDIKTGRTYLIGGGSNPDGLSGFLGCIRSLYLDSRLIPMSSLAHKDFKSNPQGVTTGTCSIIDRCTPNPCSHEGRCVQDWFNFECQCDGTGYAGAVCNNPIHPPSCEAYRLRKHLYPHSIYRPSISPLQEYSKNFIDEAAQGNVVPTLGSDGVTIVNELSISDGNLNTLTGTPILIDMDGSGPAPPFRVVCHYTTESADDNLGTHTILSHNLQWERNLVTGFQGSGSYRQKLYYDGIGQSPAMLELFVNRSLTCKQNVKYECLRAKLMNSPNWNNPSSWWVSRHNQPMYYWGGAPAGSGKCGCGVKGTCHSIRRTGDDIQPIAVDGEQSVYCNCDANLPYMTEDSGYLTEKEHLPITEIAIGDTGSVHENRKAYYTIGPLECSGDTLFQNVVTFRKAKAILTYPPIEISDAGDLQFEFKTSHRAGVFFENLGSDGAQIYIRMKMIDGKKIQLEYNAGEGNRLLNAETTDYLNDNEWHLVTFEWNSKEVRLGVDSYRPAVMTESEARFRALRNKLTRKLIIGARSDMTDGYIGCMRVFFINGQLIDLVTKIRNINTLLNSDENGQTLHQKHQHRRNIGIVEGCKGYCEAHTHFPCMNNGTCYEMWSHARCDCAWTAFRGPFCTEDVGAHLKSDTLITYRFPSKLGSLTTISEHLRVAFSTLEFQGILLEVTSYSGDFISLQLQNNGGLKIRFNFGYEPQEINDDRQVYANGQFHEVNLWRRDAGSTIVLQVDNYEPLYKNYETGFSQDTKFNDLRAIYIGRNETTPMGKGFIGCISRVVFEDYFPLKEVFGDPRPPHVSVESKLGRELVEDMCNVIPENPLQDGDENVYDEILLKRENIERVFNGFARKFPKYRGVKIATFIALLLILILAIMFGAYMVARFYTRHKGDYLTHEDAGAKDSIDADTAIMKSPIGQLDTMKKEWFF